MIQLSRKQEKIAALLMQGYSNLEIAKELHQPERTVKGYLGKMFDMFDINDGYKRVKLAIALYRRERENVASKAEGQQASID